MNDKGFELAAAIVGDAYATQARDGRRRREHKIKVLLTHSKWPEQAWDDATIELLMTELAMMDSNNFLDNAGLGEREARIVSQIVARRHFRLGHGVGRSGDIAAIQPKAAGSSLLARIAERMALDLLKMSGATRTKACIVLPVATGMSIVLTLLTLKADKPDAKYVLWHRIDQKTCFKAIITAGLVPVVIENVLEGDELRTDLGKLSEEIERLGADNILCVITTTSCFAPRATDKVAEVAVICRDRGVGHVINNAYGIQSSKCMHLVNEAMRQGRVDAFVQSTDKNLLVPVGGGIVASPDKTFVKKLSKIYPGRASSTPVVDVFITLLSLGSQGYKQLLEQRKAVYTYLKESLTKLAAAHGERVLDVKHNSISMAMTLGTFEEGLEKQGKNASFIGSMMFSRGISGARVVVPTTENTICGFTFQGYGSHTNAYPVPYVTAAAAIGMTKAEVDLCMQRMDRTLKHIRKQGQSDRPAEVEEDAAGVFA